MARFAESCPGDQPPIEPTLTTDATSRVELTPARLPEPLAIAKSIAPAIPEEGTIAQLAMHSHRSLGHFWKSLAEKSFVASHAPQHLPTLAQRYLDHTTPGISPGTPLASAVRLRMHGEIKLQRWLPFTAEQVITLDQGMIWQATVWMNGLPIVGSDQFLDGEGSLRWKLLNLWPVMTAAGSEISRSALGRVQAESVWLPSIFWSDQVAWQELSPSQLQVNFATYEQPAELMFTVSSTGQLETLTCQRWGNPDGSAFRLEPFGGIVEAERRFGDYTIPSQLRIGWYFGSDRFTSEGEFFRVTIDEAEFHPRTVV